MSRTLYLQAQLSEARGEIPQGFAAAITYASVMEAGLKAVAEGYFGRQNVAKAISDAKAEQRALDIQNGLLEDVRQVVRILSETHTTSDFPTALANLRQRILLPAFAQPESDWRNWGGVFVRTVPDFKQIRTLSIGQTGELKLRPEGTDVDFTKFSESSDGYRIANFERGLPYTWEMWLADEIGVFQRGAFELGRGAMRTETLVVFAALAALTAVDSVTVGGTTTDIWGAPTIDKMKVLRQWFTAQTQTDADGNTTEVGYDFTDVVAPTLVRDALQQILTQENEGTSARTAIPNVLRGAFQLHIERMLSRVTGSDFFLIDTMMGDWLEVAYLEGFQNGYRTYTQLPDSDVPDQGSFANHTFNLKVGTALGAKVVNSNAVKRISGTDLTP